MVPGGVPGERRAVLAGKGAPPAGQRAGRGPAVEPGPLGAGIMPQILPGPAALAPAREVAEGRPRAPRNRLGEGHAAVVCPRRRLDQRASQGRKSGTPGTSRTGRGPQQKELPGKGRLMAGQGREAAAPGPGGGERAREW